MSTGWSTEIPLYARVCLKGPKCGSTEEGQWDLVTYAKGMRVIRAVFIYGSGGGGGWEGACDLCMAGGNLGIAPNIPNAMFLPVPLNKTSLCPQLALQEPLP